MFLKLGLVVVGIVIKNNFEIYERIYVSLSRTVSNFECIDEEIKHEVIMGALDKSEMINEFIKYEGKLLRFHMFVFEVKKNLLNKSRG